MAVPDPHVHPGWTPRCRRLLAGLFEEARRLRRRRRLALVTLLGAAVAAGFVVRGGGRSAAPVPVRTSAATIVSASLPPGSDYGFVDVAGGELVVSGGVRGSYLGSLVATGSGTTFRHGRAVGTCQSAVVDPQTLRLGDPLRANCGDPALYHERVMPLTYTVRSGHHGELATVRVRIATVKPGARDGYAVGPVLTTYDAIAGVNAEWIYGDDSLWVIDPDDEVLRISTTNGQVLQRWTMPTFGSPLLAVDDDGLWLAPSIDSGVPPHASRQEKAADQSLYRVSPGARAPRRVLTLGSPAARWLVASGHTVWLQAYVGPQATEWMRLDGPRGTVVAHVRRASAGPQGEASPEFPYWFAASTHSGVYNLAIGRTDQPEQIVWQAPDSLRPRTVASIQPPAGTSTYAAAGTEYHGAFFFLNQRPLPVAPGRSTAGYPNGVIYRVTARP